nr:RNA ligase family protein [Vibrio splendidus]MCC4880445.1 RNA ligase family protein [Vibrio splendidus]
MERTKYPSTPHLPFSESVNLDDICVDSLKHLDGEEVIVSIKKDGECTTLANKYCHARSVDSKHHASRDWIKAFHGQMKYMINPNHRICGENVYALHSIAYDNLKSFFMVFNTWDQDTNMCHSWDQTLEVCEQLGLETVEVLYRGIFDLKVIQEIYDSLDKNKEEGIVVRATRSFHISEFRNYTAKAVRLNHVQTDEHWMSKPVVANGLQKS